MASNLLNPYRDRCVQYRNMSLAWICVLLPASDVFLPELPPPYWPRSGLGLLGLVVSWKEGLFDPLVNEWTGKDTEAHTGPEINTTSPAHIIPTRHSEANAGDSRDRNTQASPLWQHEPVSLKGAQMAYYPRGV